MGAHGVGTRADFALATDDVRRMLYEMGGAGLVYRTRDMWPSDYALIEETLRGLYADAVALVTRRKLHVVLVAKPLQARRYLEGHEVDAIIARVRRSFFEDSEDRFDAMDRYWGEQQMLDPRQIAA